MPTSTRFNWILARHRPFPIGTDDSNRVMFTGNYDARAYRPDDTSQAIVWEESIASLLTAASLGTLGTSIFIGPAAVIPTSIGPYISIISAGGFSPLATHDNSEAERVSCQILVRATQYTVAESRALAVYRTLRNLHEVTVTV